MRLMLTLVALYATSVAAPSALEAQERWPVFAEMTLGRGSGDTGGEYRANNNGLAAAVVVGLRLGPFHRGRLIAALDVGMQGAGPSNDRCYRASDGGCIPRFPDFTMISTLGGWESPGTRLRLLTGPGAVRVNYDWVSLAWIGRADAALPILPHAAIVGSLRGVVLPSYRGDAFRLISFAFGLRIG